MPTRFKVCVVLFVMNAIGFVFGYGIGITFFR